MKKIKFKPKKIKDMSIKHSYVLIILMIITPCFLIMSLLNYFELRSSIIDNSEISGTQSAENIANIIRTSENEYEFISNNYDSIMRDALTDFSVQYNNYSNVDNIDIEKLKENYSSKLDFYIINSNGIIVNSTLSKSIGIDFKNYPDFYSSLQTATAGTDITISNVTIDLTSGELRKWGYTASSDHKYILEVGLNSSEISEYVDNVNYSDIVQKIKNSPYISNILVYDVNYNILGNNEKTISATSKKYVKQVLETEKDKDLYLSNGIPSTKYIYLKTFNDTLNDSRKVIEIQYDTEYVNDKIHHQLILVIITFIIYTVLSIFLMIKLIGRYIANPLINLNKEISNIDINNLSPTLPDLGHNEIGILSETFVKVSRELKKSIVSQKYLENILDSVGDIVIITDCSMNIKQLNSYSAHLLGQEKSELVGVSMQSLVTDNPEVFDTIARHLHNKPTEGNVNFKIQSTNNEQYDLQSSWSALKSDDGILLGYICNAKNITAINKIIENLSETSSRDYLTGLYNHRFMKERLDSLIASSSSEYSFCVLMLDIDFFKKINDTYGHPAGDDVLSSLASLLNTLVRSNDFVCRYGGEEFLIILQGTTKDDAVSIAEDIRIKVSKAEFLNKDSLITISGGLAEWHGESSDEIIRKADERLYYSKEHGRNKITFTS